MAGLNEQKTPVAVFTYNRPVHTKTMLDSLSECDRLDECRVVVFCDGAKTEQDEPAVEASRSVVRDWAQRMGADVVARESNLGLARSIETGVTELCDLHGRVIVIEDDVILSPKFIDYMLQALDRYEDSADVYQISAYMWPINHDKQPDAFFLPMITTRGWATWSRAWRVFDWNAPGAGEALADRKTRRRFDLDNSYPYSRMLRQRLAGRNQSWGILFWWAVFNREGLVLHPRRSLVWQGGFDGTGVHSGQAESPNGPIETFDRTWLKDPIRWPESVACDEAALNRIKEFLKRASYYPGALKRSLIFIRGWIYETA